MLEASSDTKRAVVGSRSSGMIKFSAPVKIFEASIALHEEAQKNLQKIKIGTRSSPLAVIQAQIIADEIRHSYPKLDISLVTFRTKGDKNMAPFSKDPDGLKGLFTFELEQALLNHEIDFAVHSLKDLSANINPELPIVSYSHRASPFDVLVVGRETEYEAERGLAGERGHCEAPEAVAAALAGHEVEGVLVGGLGHREAGGTHAGEHTPHETGAAPVGRLGHHEGGGALTGRLGHHEAERAPAGEHIPHETGAVLAWRLRHHEALEAPHEAGGGLTGELRHHEALEANHEAEEAPRIIGSSSLRRRLQLERIFPQSKIIPVRGNINTRLNRLDTGEYSGLVLAEAGLERLGMAWRISRVFTPDEILPSPGQGILACQGRAGEPYPYLDCVNDGSSRDCALAERSFARILGAGCNVPVGAYAEINGDTLRLRGLYIDEVTHEFFRAEREGRRSDAERIGYELAEVINHERS